MTPPSGPSFIRFLEAHGWKLERIKGSHHVMGKPVERAKHQGIDQYGKGIVVYGPERVLLIPETEELFIPGKPPALPGDIC